MHRGGACKSKEHFSSHGVYNSMLKLLLFKTGNKSCNICKYNGQERCNYTAVLDNKETKRIFKEFLIHLLGDRRLSLKNNSITLRDVMPIGPVECFGGLQ